MSHILILIPFLLNISFLHIDETENYFTDKRDEKGYHFVRIDNLDWFSENLQFKTANSTSVESLGNGNSCGEFYPVTDLDNACPQGWRLPTEDEVKRLIKFQKKGAINIIDTLNINLCGRIDYDKSAKQGMQNTFWLDAPLVDGHVTHWHTFGETTELHSHDVVNANRKFPVRCVRNN